MVTKIAIQNFKSIDKLEIELGRLSVFIGANGSGKSNLLEGIAMGSSFSFGKWRYYGRTDWADWAD